ncbi:hypothetical protein CMQ_2120 [Grosmannia clavigera kw1407]|uniref:Uncharacterized protein n=1 Tax=Grosmannia clavigera (strain kw1407 / UAMH 11150) TaxID=655863 RepID=F0XJS1_GROCL|nr:uncharacterized protein CMQ_2120 [Grosmannia clavigera kw1407]EFX02071.1 hypothetical protein CMQ_2120 [Grosmannia clavigera kw1407]
MVSSASAVSPPQPGKPSSAANDAILRNALRYTMSAREYAALHKYVLSRSRMVRRHVPSVETVGRIMGGPPVKKKKKDKEKDKEEAETSSAPKTGAIVGADDFNTRAVRHALRVFAATASGMRLFGAIQRRFLGDKTSKKKPLHKLPTVRLSLSLSTILLMYRLLFRFFTRLRTTLLDPAALPFRSRNPRTAAALTSSYAPAAGASLAGLALGIAPARFRMMLALLAVFRGLEFAWNAAEDTGAIWGVDMVPVAVRSAMGAAAGALVGDNGDSAMIGSCSSSSGNDGVVLRARPRQRPWWWGSWMLQPFAVGQMLYAAVFDRDCFPSLPLGKFVLGQMEATDTYLHTAPVDASASVVAGWPGPAAVMDALAAMARAQWPAFASPILFPGKEAEQVVTLAASSPAVAAVMPSLVARAHPLVASLSCATLHPDDPSCGRTQLLFWLRSFPAYARAFLVLYTALQLPRLPQLAAALHDAPLRAIQQLVVARALRSATMLTGALSTAWASLCVFQAWLPRRVLATQRVYLGGFVAGLWAWLERRHGHAVFLYSARASFESFVRMGVKRGWWRSPARSGGDVAVFVAALLLAGTAYEREPRALREPAWRKGISWSREREA